MPIEELGTSVTDIVEAQLVDCTPPEPVDVPVPVTPETSPTSQAQAATIEQTGADPPPRGLRVIRLHRKVWLAYTSWWAVQYVAMPEFSFGIRLEPYRPLLDLFLGPLTIAFGKHPVLSDPRMKRCHAGRGFVYVDDQLRDLGTVYDVRIL